MGKIVNVVRTGEGIENGACINPFWVNDEVENVEKALRLAVKEFLGTERGEEAIKLQDGSFTWTDMFLYMEAEDFKSFGLFPIADSREEVILDAETNLIEE